MLTKWLKALQNRLLPSTCVLCGAASLREFDLCVMCEKDLPWLTQSCVCCAMPLLSESATGQQCGACLKNPPVFNQAKALFLYQAPVDKLITGLKFHKNLVNARLLGELFGQRLLADENILQTKPDFIIPVPLHPARLQERGFNQALELARPIAKKLGVPLAFNNYDRIRATQAQMVLPAKERHQNLKNAFVTRKKLGAKHVVIIDDVMTTGHTTNEFAKILQADGIEKIDVWCIARTVIF